jgi:hypothetical protein
MSDVKPLPIPAEIPWKLAATTRTNELPGPEQGEATISLFTYLPKLENLSRDYPGEQLFYLKFSVSIVPHMPPLPADDAAKRFWLFGNACPVWHAIFDVRVMPVVLDKPDIRPYVLAAAPLRRTMIETGVVGDDMFEGESSAVSIGKSGSQLHETTKSGVENSESGVGIGIGWGAWNIGAGTKGSKTKVTNERSVVQQIDTLNREASQERKELLSHMTNVTNGGCKIDCVNDASSREPV